MLRKQTPQFFDHLEQTLSALFNQHSSQQRTQATDVTTERDFLCGIGCASGQLGESGRLIASAPQGRVIHVLPPVPEKREPRTLSLIR
jgi:hypothetical protein